MKSIYASYPSCLSTCRVIHYSGDTLHIPQTVYSIEYATYNSQHPVWEVLMTLCWVLATISFLLWECMIIIIMHSCCKPLTFSYTKYKHLNVTHTNSRMVWRIIMHCRAERGEGTSVCTSHPTVRLGQVRCKVSIYCSHAWWLLSQTIMWVAMSVIMHYIISHSQQLL